jgi:uncharacterized spore protein YtfJ
MDVKELLGKVAEHLSVGRAFGPAYEKDGSLIIPVALVAGGGGGGGSEASAPESSLGDASASHDAPVTGSGGGFGGVVLPVGAYVVNGDRVRWMPAINVTLIALAALGVLRVVVTSRTMSRRHRH